MDSYAIGIIFYLAKPGGENLNGDGRLDLGLVAASEYRSHGILWSNSKTSIPNIEKVAGPSPLYDQELKTGTGASNTTVILQDFNTSENLELNYG